MEIGSGEEAWNDKDAGKRMAEAIFNTVAGDVEENPAVLPAIGVGGIHNAPVLSKCVVRNQIALGHVMPKYMLEHFSKEKIIQAMEKTLPKAKLVVADWKGLGEHKAKVREVLNKMQEERIINWKRSDKM